MSRSLGIPVKPLHETDRHVVRVELKSGVLYRVRGQLELPVREYHLHRQGGTGRCRHHHRLRHHNQRRRGRRRRHRHQNGEAVEQGHAQRSSELYGPMELVSEGVNIAHQTWTSHGEALRSVRGCLLCNRANQPRTE
ncbi:unnamed protein product, partial [Musa textilis]